MYDILELNKKLVSELRDIAKELNIKKVDSLKKQDLVYKILDQQAISATGTKKENEMAMKRTRWALKRDARKEEKKPVEIKKQNQQYSGNDKEKLVNKTIELLDKEQKMRDTDEINDSIPKNDTVVEVNTNKQEKNDVEAYVKPRPETRRQDKQFGGS